MKINKGFLPIVILLISGIFTSLPAQFYHNHGHSHGYYPDTLDVVSLSGTAIVDDNPIHTVYYLDITGNGEADYHLAFGPFWYSPQTGAQRPQDGESISITGALVGLQPDSIVIVFTINGLQWRPEIEVGQHGWDNQTFWQDTLTTIQETGTVFKDSTYFYSHYFLDTNNDTLPEYLLNFGPPWYQPASGAQRPQNGEIVTISGGLHTSMMGFETILVYEINNQKWRDPYGPAPWSGGWVHADASDTTFVYMQGDSSNWMGFAAGAMMGGMMGHQQTFPDSMFVQFEHVFPDSLPGMHNSTFFNGFYVNLYRPDGSHMMYGNGQFAMHHGRIQFNQHIRFQFHYQDEQLQMLGLDEEKIQLMHWNEENETWEEAGTANLDMEQNTFTLNDDTAYNYYALTAPSTVTAIPPGLNNDQTVVQDFRLQQNYPNPFNSSAKKFTTVNYQIPNSARVVLSVFDVQGRLVWKKELGVQQKGSYQVLWNGKDNRGEPVVSGMYFYRLAVGDQVQTKKIMVIH